MAAWYNSNPAVIEALVAAGADLEARNENSRTPRLWRRSTTIIRPSSKPCSRPGRM